MIWETVLGVLGALLLLVLLSLAMTGLTGLYRKLFERKFDKPELLLTLARFAAVITILLGLGLLLLGRHVMGIG